MAHHEHRPELNRAQGNVDQLSPADFTRISDLIGDEVGIRLPPSKRTMVEGRLRPRVRELNLASFSDYCNHLFHRNGLATERTQLINAVTTNKTDFFRETAHFQVLEQIMVPALIALRRAERMPLLKVWSAAASNGAEAYSIAMVLADLRSSTNSFRFSILGTDVSTEVLDQARRAVYPLEMVTPVPPCKQSAYLMHSRVSKARAEVRIIPELRQLTRFCKLNLMDATYPFDRDVDVIFLRNVLIYFDKLDQARVIDRLVGHLRPGGYLVLGHSESVVGAANALKAIAPAVFQKA